MSWKPTWLTNQDYLEKNKGLGVGDQACASLSLTHTMPEKDKEKGSKLGWG